MRQLKAATAPNKIPQRDEKRPSESPGKDSIKKDDKSTKSDDKSGSDTEKKKEGDKDETDESNKGDSKGREIIKEGGPGSRHSRDRTRADSRNGIRSGRSDDGRMVSISSHKKLPRLKAKLNFRGQCRVQVVIGGDLDREIVIDITLDQIPEAVMNEMS